MDDPFTPEDRRAFEEWRRQSALAERVIEKRYAELAGEDGAWIAFHEGRLIGRAADPMELRATADKLRIPWDAVYTRYLPGRDAVLVFPA